MSMSNQTIPVEILAHFCKEGLMPKLLSYGGREYPIKQVNLVHTITQGEVRIYFFSVSDDTNYWKLGFNTATLQWWIEDQFSREQFNN